MNTISFTNAKVNTQLSDERKYFLLLFVHILLGCLLYVRPGLGSFYGILITISGFLYVVWNKNQNHEVLQVAAYFIGSEVLLRMSDSFLNYEFVKYAIIVLAVLGIFYSGFSKRTIPYWVYLLALFPSIFFNNDVYHLSKTALNGFSFDLSGPICLGIVAIYCFDKKMSLATLNTILLSIGLPILSCGIYVFLYSPQISGNLTSVESNGSFSGGFGPNQVATTLGLGTLIFFIQLVINANTRIRFVIHLLAFSLLCYLGLLTFSRGGMITGLAACIVFLVSIYYNSKAYGKTKAKQGMVCFIATVLVISTLISYQTNGLIEKRYTNRDHLGRIKRDKATDRKELAKEEIILFVENPVLGIGAGKGTQIRQVEFGSKVQSHDELTRLLAEHGVMGLIDILILIIVPLLLFFKSRQNVFLATFFAFWFLTINHSGMRTAAPAFIYALMLLKIAIDDEPFFTKQTLKDI
ncbi:O-antigen ligase family protein [Flavobacterium sp.]|uniref:O-antigen ligase family protein n=1 Tax=Flavobacterium sp. TaxID=239 RepID=UPI00286A8DD4|nr:O-antigen ligase family protein [Flavobacterium sp.]